MSDLSDDREQGLAASQEVISSTEDCERIARDYPNFFASGYEVGSRAVANYEPDEPGNALSDIEEVVKEAKSQGYKRALFIDGTDMWRLPFSSEKSLAMTAGIFAGIMRALIERAASLDADRPS